MTLGLAERQGRLGNMAVARCEAELPARSLYRLLHAERDRLFSRRAVRRPVRPARPPVGAAVDPGGGDGVAAAGGLFGPRGLRPVRL
jgi:hypothetical protein